MAKDVKVLLKNDGMFSFLEDVDFPVIVNARKVDSKRVRISNAELFRAGGNVPLNKRKDEEPSWTFYIGDEVDIIND